jgi:GT2 family glycosyltransferase
MTPQTDARPRFSVVVNTNGRRATLALTLRCLDYLDYPDFEVIVVAGPAEDGTAALLAAHAGRIKQARCPVLNLSTSRNIAIGLAAGEIVAFIDDDAVAEPQWLAQLAAGYADDRVAGTGGIVLDDTGLKPQYRYATANRMGRADIARTVPANDLCVPDAPVFPYLQGTNASFRRAALVEAGGFDEEYDFYLDETDLCCRLVDAGYRLNQLPDAWVHHQFAASHLRNAAKVTFDRYPVIKNKVYFSLVNNHGHHGVAAVLRDALQFHAEEAWGIHHNTQQGLIPPAMIERFDTTSERAIAAGLLAGLRGQRRLRPAGFFAALQAPFLSFLPKRPPGERRVLCFADPDALPEAARASEAEARAAGHHVHRLQRAAAAESCGFAGDHWVHALRWEGDGDFAGSLARVVSLMRRHHPGQRLEIHLPAALRSTRIDDEAADIVVY